MNDLTMTDIPTSLTESVELSRAKRFKAATRSDHDHVDELVMASKPFESASRYADFLTLQHRFHGALHAHYLNPLLNEWLPGLAGLSRLEAVEADMTDLGIRVPPRPAPAPITSPEQALGWFYCSEGSNLGAAFLFKQTQRIGLDQHHGARHLAAHDDGRGAHWRAFVAQLDAVSLTTEQDREAESGARAAFDFYRAQLADVMGNERPATA